VNVSQPVAASDHPIRLTVTDDLVRSRVTVFFRLLLAIPHYIWLELWGIVVVLTVFLAWLAALFTGRVPGGLHSFIASYLNYSTHVYAYLLLIANPYPSFSGSASYPVDVSIAGPEAQGRLTVLFRLFLAVPALALTYVFRIVNQIIAILSWFYALFTGRMNGGMRDLSAWLLRYETQTYAYMALLTARYPSLAGAPTV
jgi:Domain of unknown function (DUF4389)